MQNSKAFGLIPAAGHSRRMGQHKLLLPWQGGRVIDAVLNAWTSCCVDRVGIVVRIQDKLLIQACAKWPVDVIELDIETADMKQTVQKGLDYASENWAPDYAADHCLIAPADLPKMSAKLLDAVVAAANANRQIIVPVFEGKSGHPVSFPWSFTTQIFALESREGLDSLIRRNEICELRLEAGLRPRDIDTPEDYQREIESC